jgi:hypothetical protein
VNELYPDPTPPVRVRVASGRHELVIVNTGNQNSVMQLGCKCRPGVFPTTVDVDATDDEMWHRWLGLRHVPPGPKNRTLPNAYAKTGD